MTSHDRFGFVIFRRDIEAGSRGPCHAFEHYHGVHQGAFTGVVEFTTFERLCYIDGTISLGWSKGAQQHASR